MKFVLGDARELIRMSWGAWTTSTRISSSTSTSRSNPEYWRRQGYTTFQHESHPRRRGASSGRRQHHLGLGLPAPGWYLADSLKVIEADLGRLDARARRKITCENAGKLYGFM